MEIAYAGGRRLLVPLPRLDLVQSRGSIRDRPAAQPTRRNFWNKTKARVKKGLRDMAEGSRLYAERQLARAPILAGDTTSSSGSSAPPFHDETPDQAGGDHHRSRGHDAVETDGPPALRRRRIRQDRGGDARRVPRHRFEFQVAVLAPTTISPTSASRSSNSFDGFAVAIERISGLRVGKDLKELKGGSPPAGRRSDRLPRAVEVHRVPAPRTGHRRRGTRFEVAQKERLKQLRRTSTSTRHVGDTAAADAAAPSPTCRTWR
ncbi:MAG: hypothetical protein R2862_06015 [Thermoanaerobaculia bacterium]